MIPTCVNNSPDFISSATHRPVTPTSIEDTEWLGAAYFLNTPGYYDVLRATQPVEGFVFDPDSDWIDAQVGTPPPWGRPTCRDWWLDPTVGLRQHILDTLPIDTQEALATHDNPLPPKAQDNAVRALLTGSVLISSLILWAYIWQLIEWLDNALIHALYGEGLFQHTPQAFLADGVIGTLMIIAPLFWFTVMGAFGVASGQGIERLWAGLMAPSAAAAEAGGQQLGKVITQSVGRVAT